MSKTNFITLVLGIIGGLLFSLGMCMCLLPEWNMFNLGLICGFIGFVVIVITVLYYRKKKGLKKININKKILFRVLYGIISSLVLGIGMSLIMVFEDMILLGIIIGIIGIVMLLFLIPMCLGFKENE